MSSARWTITLVRDRPYIRGRKVSPARWPGQTPAQVLGAQIQQFNKTSHERCIYVQHYNSPFGRAKLTRFFRHPQRIFGIVCRHFSRTQAPPRTKSRHRRAPDASPCVTLSLMRTLTLRTLLVLPPTCSPHGKARAEAAASAPRQLCPCRLCLKRMHAQIERVRGARVAVIANV